MAAEVVLSAKSLGLLQDVPEEGQQQQQQQQPPPTTAAAGSPAAAAGPGGAAIGKTNVLAAAANLVGLEAGSCEVGGDEEMDETLKAEDDEEDDDDDIDSEDEGGEGMVKIDGLTGEAAFEKRGRHTGAKALFLQKLYDILENDENQDYVVWANNGEHILIKDPEGVCNLLVVPVSSFTLFCVFLRNERTNVRSESPLRDVHTWAMHCVLCENMRVRPTTSLHRTTCAPCARTLTHRRTTVVSIPHAHRTHHNRTPCHHGHTAPGGTSLTVRPIQSPPNQQREDLLHSSARRLTHLAHAYRTRGRVNPRAHLADTVDMSVPTAAPPNLPQPFRHRPPAHHGLTAHPPSLDRGATVCARAPGLSLKVLPKYYNHSNFKSFVRQLHMYSFRKLQVDPDGDCYRCIFQQPRFKRGQRHLLKTIKRKTSSLGSMTRISTAKVTNVLKDLADMRHELRANASRMVMMEKHLRMMTARCNLLEEERRTYAHHQGMPPHLPLPPELKDVAGSYGSGAPNSASAAAAAAAVSYANAQAAAQQAAHVAAMGNGDGGSLSYGGPFAFPGGNGPPQQMPRGPNGGPPQEATTVFYGDPQQQQHHPFQQQQQPPQQHHPGMHPQQPQQQQHPHGPPQYMMQQQGGGPPHMQQQQMQQQQQQQQQQPPPGYGGGPGGGMNPYQIGGMSPPPGQGGNGGTVNGGPDHGDDRFGGSTGGGGGEAPTQGQQPMGQQQQQQFDFPLQSPGMAFAPMPGMPSGAQQMPMGTTSMASGGQGPSYTTTAAGGGGPPPTMAPPGGAPTRADGTYVGTADGAPMAGPFPGGPPQQFKPPDQQQFFNGPPPGGGGGGPPNGQPYVIGGAPQAAPLGGGTSSGLFLSAVSASVDSTQTTMAVSQA